MPNAVVARDLSWIRCLTCGNTSYNRNDVGSGYCGHCHEFFTDFQTEAPPAPECDFCSTDPPVWKYPAQSFDTGEKVGLLQPESTGAWLACETCSDLIERNDREGLTVRAVETFLCNHSEFRSLPHPTAFRDQILSATKQMHTDFLRHRTGARTRWP